VAVNATEVTQAAGIVAAAGLLMATGPQDKDVGGSSDKVPPQDPQQPPADEAEGSKKAYGNTLNQLGQKFEDDLVQKLGGTGKFKLKH
jgi:hypothetical protein